MKPFRIPARIARRLARKLVKPAALWLIEAQLRSSKAQAERFYNEPGDTMPFVLYERQRQVELIGRRNLIRGW